MFDMDLEGKIRSITSQAKDEAGTIICSDLVTIHFEFDKEFATGVGTKEAVQLERMIRDGSLASASLTIDGGIGVICRDASKGEVETQGKGRSLKLKRANAADVNPIASFRFTIATEDAAHMWFVHHLSETVDCKIFKAQDDLPGIK